MRTVILSAVIITALTGHPAFAEEANTQEQPTRIEIDQEHGSFVFIIDSEPAAMLDKDGLHVVGGIDYGLSLTDTGPDWVTKKIASKTATKTKETADE